MVLCKISNVRMERYLIEGNQFQLHARIFISTCWIYRVAYHYHWTDKSARRVRQMSAWWVKDWRHIANTTDIGTNQTISWREDQDNVVNITDTATKVEPLRSSSKASRKRLYFSC